MHLDISTFSNPVIKATYEVVYALTVGLYDDTALAYKPGCSVSSTASANRRSGITVSYEATVTHAETAAAEQAAETLAADQSAFVSHVTAARAHVQATTSLDTSALSGMAIPTAASVTANTPVVITEAPTAVPIDATDDDAGFSLDILVYTIGGAVVAALVVAGSIIALCWYCCMAKSAPGQPVIYMKPVAAVKDSSVRVGVDLEKKEQRFAHQGRSISGASGGPARGPMVRVGLEDQQ